MPFLVPEEIMLLFSLKDSSVSQAFDRNVTLHDGGQVRHVRADRDYGTVNRSEAPQYYLEARASNHEEARSRLKQRPHPPC